MAGLLKNMRLPVIAAPMFLVSGPALVISACKSGVCGTFPSLNGRTAGDFESWLKQITGALNPDRDAPFGVNLIVHRSNKRLDEDLALCEKYKVPLVITSVGGPKHVVERVHSYGGLVYHDVINVRFARKAIEGGVDGLIVVAAGAGGHAGTVSPFAMIPRVREFFNGPLCLAGAISDGAGVAAARVLGADYAYLGTRFIATKESQASEEYKQMIVDSEVDELVYTNKFSGINANFMRRSIEKAGMDPDNLDALPDKKIDMGGSSEKKAWKDVWSAGSGIGVCHDIPSVQDLVASLDAGYRKALSGDRAKL